MAVIQEDLPKGGLLPGQYRSGDNTGYLPKEGVLTGQVGVNIILDIFLKVCCLVNGGAMNASSRLIEVM